MANNGVPVTPDKPKQIRKITHQGVTAVKTFIEKLDKLIETDLHQAIKVLGKIQDWKANYDLLNNKRQRSPYKEFWEKSPAEARTAMAELLYLGDDNSPYYKVKAKYDAKIREVLEETENEDAPPPPRPNNDINNFQAPSEVSDPNETGSSSSSNPPPRPQTPPRDDLDHSSLLLSPPTSPPSDRSNADFGDDEHPPGDDLVLDLVNDKQDDHPLLIDNDAGGVPPAIPETLRSQLGVPEHNGAFPEPTISGNRKWGPDQAEWQKEGGRPRMQQSPHDRLLTTEALLMDGSTSGFKPQTDERIQTTPIQIRQFEDQVLDYTPQAMAQKRVGMAMQLADDIFAADFRAWMTNGRTIIHEKPEVRNVVAKRQKKGLFRFQRDRDPQTAISANKQLRLPATPQWSSLHKIRGAQEYIDTFVDQEAAFQRKLNAMLLRGPQTIDEAFWYYKFVIRGEVATAEDKELFNQL